MKRETKIINKKSQIKLEKKVQKVKADYEKIFTEIAPFIPKVEVREPSTEGRWQTSSGYSLY